MKRQTVSLCVIARDEEGTIGATIKSVLALVDEVVVVDTGSLDNTRIIAEGYGARVVDVPWEDDFSAARNAALAEAHGDWVLFLDADEHLQPVRPVEFQRLLNDPGAAGYRLRMISANPAEVEATEARVRLFRNVRDVRYKYHIFERIVPALQEWCTPLGLRILDADLAVMHEGCRPERRARSRERNLRLLRRAVSLHPDEPYFHYQLGCEGIALLDEEVLPVAGLEQALGHLLTAWRRTTGHSVEARQALPWVADLAARIISALLAQERVDEALAVANEARDVFPHHPLVLLQAVAVNCRLLAEDSEQWAGASAEGLITRCRDDLDAILAGRTRTYGSAVDSRVRDLYPLRYLGSLALLEGRVSEAVGLFERALDLDPSYSYAWLGMAECSRFAGDRKRALKLYLRTVTENAGNHRAWLRGCDLMREMEFSDNAESWWRKVVDQFPEHPVVRRARCVETAPEPEPSTV